MQNKWLKKQNLVKFHGMLLFLGALLMLFDGFDLTIYGAVVPTIMEEWGISAVQAGMYGSYALFGMMFGALIFGTLADKLGRKKIMMICVLIFSVFMLLADWLQARIVWTVPFHYGFRIRRHDAKCHRVN